MLRPRCWLFLKVIDELDASGKNVPKQWRKIARKIVKEKLNLEKRVWIDGQNAWLENDKERS